LQAEIKLMEAAGDAPVVQDALAILRTAQEQLGGEASTSRKGKAMYSLSADASRMSSRRRPSRPSDATGNAS
jgi:hypothetical protein